jgi:hypothetical protein
VQAQDDAGNLGIPATLTIGHGASTTAHGASKQSGGLAKSHAARAADNAKPAGASRGLLGGLGALVLLIGLAMRRRRSA